MTDRIDIRALKDVEPEKFSGEVCPLGVYRSDFQHKEESLRFFRECVGDEVYAKAMNSDAGRTHHYTVARAFLSQENWEKFVWIEQYGSLAGFPKCL